MNNPPTIRSDGYQAALFGVGAFTYTILQGKDPKKWPTFSIESLETDVPSEATVAAYALNFAKECPTCHQKLNKPVD